MTDITIPPEALEAARAAWLESASDYTRLDDSIRAALRAGIAAWPGVHVFDRKVECEGDYVNLPLPQETRDE